MPTHQGKGSDRDLAVAGAGGWGPVVAGGGGRGQAIDRAAGRGQVVNVAAGRIPPPG